LVRQVKEGNKPKDADGAAPDEKAVVPPTAKH